MKHKLRMIWRILRDRQVVVITESYGKLYYDNMLYPDAIKEYTFADGSTFGIMEDYI